MVSGPGFGLKTGPARVRSGPGFLPSLKILIFYGRRRSSDQGEKPTDRPKDHEDVTLASAARPVPAGPGYGLKTGPKPTAHRPFSIQLGVGAL